MRAATLKLKNYISKVDIIDNGNLEHRLFHLMLMAFGALALSYVFILGNMVFNIIERRAFEREAITLGNEVGDIELSYLSLSNKVDLEFSKSLGFREVKAQYATRKTLGYRPTDEALGLNQALSLKADNEI